MQTENRTQPRGRDRWRRSRTKLGAKHQTTHDEKNREHREHVERFGPLPGEVYADEAHFGSFS